MEKIVKSEYPFYVGGPAEETRKLVTIFKEGEKLTLVCVSAKGEYPPSYEIKEHPEVGVVTRGMLRSFVEI